MPSSTHWFLAASSETGATGVLRVAAVAAGGAVACGELDGEIAVLVATVPADVSVNVSVVVTPAGVTLVWVTPGGAPAGVAVV